MQTNITFKEIFNKLYEINTAYMDDLDDFIIENKIVSFSPMKSSGGTDIQKAEYEKVINKNLDSKIILDALKYIDESAKYDSKREQFRFISNEIKERIIKMEEENKQKPKCKLIGEDGNIYNLMGIASRTLKRNGMGKEADEMCNKITTSAKSYYEALNILSEYVDIVGEEEQEDEEY